MGYDVHIVRGEEWSEPDEAIGLDEWAAVVAGYPDMEVTGSAETEVPAPPAKRTLGRLGRRGPAAPPQVLRIEQEGLAEWSGHPSGDTVWFCPDGEGCIVVRNPDEAVLARMVELAQRLGARVQGDDGEFYDED
jgi:hypothetical protein